MHGETGAKLDSETRQIACEMKQTTPGKTRLKTKKNKNKTRLQNSVEQDRLAQKENRNKTNTLSFCSTYFRLQMTKQQRES